MENENGNFQGWPGIRPTLGEILPGGVVYELVQSRSGHGVELLRSEAETYEIAPQFKEGETIYTPGYLHSSLFGATWFAREPAEYGLPSNLFWNAADPGWTPLFLTAGALVMEMGGANSHGAVVAREYGIPAVVGVPDAVSRITTGQLITVDGALGTVTPVDQD